jgi:hypothetical protein
VVGDSGNAAAIHGDNSSLYFLLPGRFNLLIAGSIVYLKK